jgi:hypothetical protein
MEGTAVMPSRRCGPETAENNLGQCAGRVGRMLPGVIPVVQVARTLPAAPARSAGAGRNRRPRGPTRRRFRGPLRVRLRRLLKLGEEPVDGCPHAVLRRHCNAGFICLQGFECFQL